MVNFKEHYYFAHFDCGMEHEVAIKYAEQQSKIDTEFSMMFNEQREKIKNNIELERKRKLAEKIGI